jgi:hypothetical protein
LDRGNLRAYIETYDSERKRTFWAFRGEGEEQETGGMRHFGILLGIQEVIQHWAQAGKGGVRWNLKELRSLDLVHVGRYATIVEQQSRY